jgi:hypothetical protein
MPTQRTLAQLLGLFFDNDDGDISAGDGRDLVATSFGYFSPVDPTPDNDKADSAGIGQFFDIGNKWLNTATQVLWTCWSGAVHMAVWQPDFNGAPSPPAGSTLGRLTSSGAFNTNLKATGLTGTTTNNSPTVTGISDVDIASMGLGALLENNVNLPLGGLEIYFITYSPGNNSVELSGNALVTGACSLDCTPFTYEWIEQTADPITGEPYDKPGGIVGTQSTGPLINVGGLQIDHVIGMQVLVHPRGEASSIPIYSMDVWYQYSLPNQLALPPATTPTLQLPQTTPATTPPPGTVYVDAFGALIFINSLGVAVTLVSPNQGASTVIVPYRFNFASPTTTFGGQQYFVLDALLANVTIGRIWGKTIIDWSSFPILSIGYVKTGDTAGAGFFNSVTSHNLPQIEGCFTGSFASSLFPYSLGSYSLVIGPINLTGVTAGQTTIWVEYFTWAP